MGRKPTPLALKLLNGNPGRRPLNLDEPIPAPLDDGIPAELSAGVARHEWQRTIVPAIAIGHITSADRTLAIAHCELFAQWQAQLTSANGAPHLVITKNGYPMANPMRVMANRSMAILAGIDEKLGLSPTSRTRVVATKPADADAPPNILDKYLRR